MSQESKNSCLKNSNQKDSIVFQVQCLSRHYPKGLITIT